MSRIGKLPIEIPKGVKVTYNEPSIMVEGPKGTLSRNVMKCVALELSDTTVVVKRVDDGINARSAHGLTSTLINNMVTGVTKGFETALEIRSEEHTSELQSRGHLVCRLLLEKK